LRTPYIDIIESTPRNTAAAIAFAAFASDPEAVLIVTLLIILSVMLICMKNQCKKLLIKQNGFIVTFGIVPKPETGYGYIERDGDNVLSFQKTKSSFSERFHSQRKFLWNSGMFCFKQAGVIRRIEKYTQKFMKSK
jgi:mannose-1-phosphate guanylyltransferase